MRYTSPNNQPAQTGFTLVEVLIVAPLALLVISGFVALMVTLTGDVLASNARTRLIQKTDVALERFEQDVRFTNEFRATSFTPSVPQGRGNDAQAFDVYAPFPGTNNVTYGTIRILRSYATDKNPLDPTKKLIYTSVGGGACGTATETQNQPLKYDIVYYTKRDAGTSGSTDERLSLWRRIIFDPTGLTQLCGSATAIWQKSTCAPGGSGTPCQAEDEKIIDNVQSVIGYYPNTPDQSYNGTIELDCIQTCPHSYDLSGSTNSGHSGHTADDIDNVLSPYSDSGQNASSSFLSIHTKTTVAGRDAEYSGGVYARRIN